MILDKWMEAMLVLASEKYISDQISNEEITDKFAQLANNKDKKLSLFI